MRDRLGEVFSDATPSLLKKKRGIKSVVKQTHKTGGTTLTNILLRYAEKHRLVTGLPFGVHWELAGYPAKFDRSLIDPVLGKYNMLCHHFRLFEFFIVSNFRDMQKHVFSVLKFIFSTVFFF